MKSLMLLWKRLAEESASWCCTRATMDINYVQSRVEHEGLSFLTITLPAFCKDFEESLDIGQVDRRLFTGFRWKGGLPLFLGGFLDQVFDRCSGVLLDKPSHDAIRAIRQLTLIYSKISLPASNRRVRKAMADYVKCEQEIRGLALDDKSCSDFHRMSRLLFAESLTVVDRAIYRGEIIPRHGPGATADSLRGNGKFRQHVWTDRLESIFPSGEMLLPNWSFYDQMESIDFLEPGSEIPVKVISVPKTLKTPRIIAMEPTAMQYVQQAILPEILTAIKRDYLLDSCLGFDDQAPNQEAARRGSLYGDLATLDLSEASDRVSNQLVEIMMSDHPHLGEAVQACRSTRAAVPGHGVVPLAKFASMGSALTFPIEAMVFLTLVALGIEKELNTRFSQKDAIRHLRGKVRIYGDDIIVPVMYVRSVIDHLESFGLVVNRRKSFWNGKFRESCGKDYYEGFDVSVVRFRTEFPTSRRHVSGIISTISFRNQLYFAGYWESCKWLDRKIGLILKYYPVVLPSSPVLGRHSFLGYSTQRTHSGLFSPLVKGWVVHSVSPKDLLDDTGALLKFLLRKARRDRYSPLIGSTEPPQSDSEHLERAGRPHAVNIKLRWASPV